MASPASPADERHGAGKLLDVLESFHRPVAHWFRRALGEPTAAQRRAWPVIAQGASTLLLSPTGSGKTLAAFLVAIDRTMFAPAPDRRTACRTLYVSPLKALAVDVEKNLERPIAGIGAAADELGETWRRPSVAVRSGDTPQRERTRIARTPPDILITTPESLYLLLTSAGRDLLRSVETVIVDEVHAVVATKRGVHLALSLERLEELRGRGAPPLQRIGLSATQRPLDEIARFLGGADVAAAEPFEPHPRPVTVVDAGAKKAWDIRVEVPAGGMPARARGGAGGDEPTAGQASLETESASRPSIWPSIHPRLVELVRAHRSTMIFANSRRLAERLAAALNDVAGEPIARAHHGSLAKEQRLEIEDQLKSGALPAIVATSSLELGIDMGAVDLVIQIEAPPSVSAGIQRIGRAGHSVGATSSGVVFPKFRGDLLACAATVARMREGAVEAIAYPRCPLDVLAQQIVAMAAMDVVAIDDVFALVRRAAPMAELPRGSFEGVLDMLSGKYPSDELATLKARITWDRAKGTLKAREGARSLAVTSGGTIPDRGLYGVFLADEAGGRAKTSRRVGELDEEMVFESRVGEVFLLGASSWRIEEIGHDRVIVRPAPGEPGKMPFWRGDRPGRPFELGQAIGALARELVAAGHDEALGRVEREGGLTERAAEDLWSYLADQVAATEVVPSDRAIIVERTRDELGSYRVCVLSPFGSRVHAPWVSAVQTRWSDTFGTELEAIWSDDGMVFRVGTVGEEVPPPDASLFVPAADEVEALVLRGVSQTSLFGARFREAAARALLLPRRRPGQRVPLWAQRKRAADLLSVAARHGSFPIVLEAYRECLRDAFDLPALTALLRGIERGDVRLVSLTTDAPSPFAASVMFSYVGSFLYDGDAPLAERRAHALTVDPAQLRDLLGEAPLSSILDPTAVSELEAALGRRDGKRFVASADGVHDLFLSLGDLTANEVAVRAEPDARGRALAWLAELEGAGRIVAVTVAAEARFIAVEDAARYRDALGVALPKGVPAALLAPVAAPLDDLCSRFARTHGPFLDTDVAARFGAHLDAVQRALARLAEAGRVVLGESTPDGAHGYCDTEVLRTLKRRSLSSLRREVEPAPAAAFGRLSLSWHGVSATGPRRGGVDALLSAVERLAGAPLPASALESEILPARVDGYRPGDLDALTAAGEVVWLGCEPIGTSDGRVALYLADRAHLLAPAARAARGGSPPNGPLVDRIRELFAGHGALFFADLAAATDAFAPDLAAALWELVWAGELTNDTLAPLRSRLGAASQQRGGRSARAALRDRARALPTRRSGPPGTEGRWSLVSRSPSWTRPVSDTERLTARAQALLDRHGVLTREAVAAEGIEGGFGALYPVLSALEERGRIRRGYFVAGLGAAQFALPAAVDRLRSLRAAPELGRESGLVLAATDPASPWGAALPWPAGDAERAGDDGESVGRPQRAAGAHVVVVDGELVAWLGRGDRSMRTFLPAGDPARGAALVHLASTLAALVDRGERRAIVLEEIDGAPAPASGVADALVAEGFVRTTRGLFRRPRRIP